MKKKLSYILNHLGEDRELYYNAVSPPIIQTSNFAFANFKDFRDAIVNEKSSHIYTRGNNPTVDILRKKIAALEHTEDALAFSSGSGAVAAAMMTFLKAGDHVICVNNPYSWTKALLNEVLPKFNISVDYVDGQFVENFAQALRTETRMIFLESPNSATFELQDLEAISHLAKSHGIISAIDNSYCSPIYQNPAKLGIDLVIHSGTKYLNGHSDVVCGFVCGNAEHISRIFHFATMTLGNILSPAEASLVIRGLRTLEIRMNRSQETTVQVVRFLKQHPLISKVFYPWDVDFPQYSLARKQMSGAGGLFSIMLKTDEIKDIEIFCESLQYFLFAVSWGGHESLILPFASLMNIDSHPNPDVPFNLVRFYVGLEDASDLISDLENALSVIS